MPEPSPDTPAPAPTSAPHAPTQPSLAEVAQAAKRDGAPKPIGMACRACRQRKIRCGGERPRCSYCVKKGYECVLTPHKKRGRPRKTEARASNKLQHELLGGGGSEETQAEGAAPAELLDGLDLDVGQLWAELTGLQGIKLPAELSALAAGAPWQPDATMAANEPTMAPGNTALFAGNYAFPHMPSAPDAATPTAAPPSA
ncbi:hypothetical protein LPJ73_007709, partial [Coemansia sp. RSA 2703]